MPFLLLLLFSTVVSAAPQPPELDRTLVSLLAEGEGELWLQGDYVDDSLNPTGYGSTTSGLDFSKTLSIGGRYGVSDSLSLKLSYGQHDDQAWRLGEPKVTRSQYDARQFSLQQLLISDAYFDISANLGWRSHQADTLFQDAYSLSNTALSNTTTAYAQNNQLRIDRRTIDQISVDYGLHQMSLDTATTDITIQYREEGDGFFVEEYNSLLRFGTDALLDTDFTNGLAITSSIDLSSNTFPQPLASKLPLSDPSTPYTYLTQATAYDRGISGGLMTSFYPDERLRFSLGATYRAIEVSPAFSIHPDLKANTEEIANTAEQIANFITSDATDNLGNRNVNYLANLSGESTDTLTNLATLLNQGAADARNYLTELDRQTPQANPWDENHLLLSAGVDWWPYDDLGYAFEYTYYTITRSGYQSEQGKISLNVADQTTNHQLDGWLFVKPTPDLTLYLHGRAYSNFLLGDRPLLYNARVNHRFEDPYGYLSAGLVWQF
jgi:hypothetical protein